MAGVRLLFILTLIVTVTASTAQESTDAKEWLAKSIKKYFDDGHLMHINKITTERYAEYKQDAINIVYDVPNSLTEDQFKQKWDNIYDISYAGMGNSFLIGQQDHGIVIMSKCDLISQTNTGIFIFDTTISDSSFKLTYSIEITVVKTMEGFKIDDVKKKRK